ncbi:MAG: MFS transporter, partial [Micrococcales bacterium]|nr:MFS transporter [Micrococcales bacterium]
METESPMSPWRFVVWWGTVSLLADVVYEGARSITGPYLLSLGASAATVGIISGVGEATALIGRLFSGPLADSTRAYWPLAIGGYAMTAVSVPLLGLTPVLWVGAALLICERAGKALRTPSRDAMLAHATSGIGRGKGFAVHEVLDQVGATLGPLAVAFVFSLTSSFAPSFAMLALPGAAAIALLIRLRRQIPDPAVFERATASPDSSDLPPESPAAGGSGVGELGVGSGVGELGVGSGVGSGAGEPAAGSRFRAVVDPLPPLFWRYLAFTMTATAGFSTFAVLGVHLVRAEVARPSVVPVLYAVAMVVDAVCALVAGHAF